MSRHSDWEKARRNLKADLERAQVRAARNFVNEVLELVEGYAAAGLVVEDYDIVGPTFTLTLREFGVEL